MGGKDFSDRGNSLSVGLGVEWVGGVLWGAVSLVGL